MIYWLSIPIPVPTLGMVAWWLVIGCVFLVSRCAYMISKTCDVSSKAKSEATLLGALMGLTLWPVFSYLMLVRVIAKWMEGFEVYSVERYIEQFEEYQRDARPIR